MDAVKPGRSVLIVDDDRFLIDMYSVKFKERGFSVEVSEGGEGALQKLRGGYAPDAILLDIVMPGTDGFSVLEAIRKEKLGKDPTIIALSNQSQEADMEKAKSLGAHAYIVKASTIPSEVLERVVEAVKAHKGA